jgi:hypothetical protein
MPCHGSSAKFARLFGVDGESRESLKGLAAELTGTDEQTAVVTLAERRVIGAGIWPSAEEALTDPVRFLIDFIRTGIDPSATRCGFSCPCAVRSGVQDKVADISCPFTGSPIFPLNSDKQGHPVATRMPSRVVLPPIPIQHSFSIPGIGLIDLVFVRGLISHVPFPRLLRQNRQFKPH